MLLAKKNFLLRTKFLVRSLAGANGFSSVRAISYSSFLFSATRFGMPAMSPTMSEGGIVKWAIKEGEKFSVGDVVLEIETDKAQIDVESQEDGVLAKILKKEGEKNIPVGATIAYVAEIGDDLSKLDYPPPLDGLSSSSDSSPKANSNSISSDPAPTATSTPSTPPAASSSKTTPVAKSDANKNSSISSNASSAADKNQVLLPSVEKLLHTNNISKQDAINNIKATGLNGKLLKGDVLAYLGLIPKSAPSELNEAIKKLQHLDLSNIKIAKESKTSSSNKEVDAKKIEKPKPIIISELFSLKSLFESISSLFSSDASTISNSLTEKLINKANKLALNDLYTHSYKKYISENDKLYDQILSPPTGTLPFDVKFHLPKIPTKPQPSIKLTSNSSLDDIYDILSKPTFTKNNNSQASSIADSSDLLKVDLTLNPSVYDSKQEAEVYIKRFKYYLNEGVQNILL